MPASSGSRARRRGDHAKCDALLFDPFDARDNDVGAGSFNRNDAIECDLRSLVTTTRDPRGASHLDLRLKSKCFIPRFVDNFNLDVVSLVRFVPRDSKGSRDGGVLLRGETGCDHECLPSPAEKKELSADNLRRVSQDEPLDLHRFASTPHCPYNCRASERRVVRGRSACQCREW